MQDQLSATGLTDEQEALLPTEEEVKWYREHGYYLSRKILTDEVIDAAITGSDRFYAVGLDEPPDIPALERYRPTGEYPGLRKHDYATLFKRELARLVKSPIIGAIGARLSGGTGIRLWHDQLLYKPVDASGSPANVGWHTDRQYWKTCSSTEMLTAWIPFHDCTEEMGTITFIDGSNRWPDNTQGLNFFENDLEGLEQRFDTGGRAVVKAPANLEKGQVSFHNCLTIHGSGPNRSAAPRRSIAVHMQPEDNRYTEYWFEAGELARHANDILVRDTNGHPDYADPVVCPLLYRERT